MYCPPGNREIVEPYQVVLVSMLQTTVILVSVIMDRQPVPFMYCPPGNREIVEPYQVVLVSMLQTTVILVSVIMDR